MAITRAQQVRQMYKQGSKKPVVQGGVDNYLGKQPQVVAPRKWQSGPDKPPTELAYITEAEKKLLLKADIHGSLKEGPNEGPAGIMSLDSFGDIGGAGQSGADFDRDPGGSGTFSGQGPNESKREFENRKKKQIENLKNAERVQRERLAKQKAEKIKQEKIKKAKIKAQKEKAEKIKKAKKELSDLGKKTTTKYGTVVGPMSPEKRDFLGKSKLDLSYGVANEEDDLVDKATAKEILDQNILKRNLSKFKPPSVSLLEGITSMIPGRSLSEMYEEYGKTDKFKKRFPGIDSFEDYEKAVSAGMISAKGGPMGDYSYGGVDSQGDPIFTDRGGGQDQPIVPIVPTVPTTTGSVFGPTNLERPVEDNTTDLDDYIAKIREGAAYRFFADGGRVPAQQGGIMPRLNQLGSGVSSAEQMLQEINQRLDSAESTLGDGEGGGLITSSQIPFRPLPGFYDQLRQMPIGQTTPKTALPGNPMSPIAGSIPTSSRPSYEDALSSYNQRMQSGIMTNDIERNRMRSRENYDLYNNNTSPKMQLRERFESMYPPGHPMRNFGYMRDGGRAGYNMGGRADDDPVGGIMDLESGRQMYFLGKLVKKATNTIKKIVKSPVGKAALLYGAGSLGASLLGKAKAGEGLGFLTRGKDFLTRSFLGKEVRPGDRSGGILSFIKNNPFASILGASTLAGLMTPKQQQEDDEDVYLGPSIDIAAIRRNPYAAMGETYRHYAEGGKAEPVAKKTMPLLDMDGMEKDYRADGGFVPIGRMERADDVPARLSKNEFVFTADAVRNAGDGDVDKGAEVMYNMMKNLEAGGNVSEESQGLDGARKMFQTSQRLGEVI